MSRIKTHFLVYFVIAVLLSIAGGASASVNSGRKVSKTQSLPYSLPQALQIEDLQPYAPELSDSVGSMQSHGIIRGNWRYVIEYRYTEQGWRLTSYSAKRIAKDHKRGNSVTERQTEGRSEQPRLNLITPPGDDPGGGGNLPPGPGKYPDPPIPDDPDASGNSNISQHCPYPGTSYDTKVEWQWIPGHFVGDTWIPGHWEMVEYTAAMHPADFCK